MSSLLSLTMPPAAAITETESIPPWESNASTLFPLLFALRQNNPPTALDCIVEILDRFPEGAKCQKDRALKIAAFNPAVSCEVMQRILAIPSTTNDDDTNTEEVTTAMTNVSDGMTPLHYIQGLDIAKLQLLMQAYPQGVLTRDFYGRLPLHYTMLRQSTADLVVSLLIEEGKRQQKTLSQTTNHDATSPLLLCGGVLVKDYLGQTPLDLLVASYLRPIITGDDEDDYSQQEERRRVLWRDITFMARNALEALKRHGHFCQRVAQNVDFYILHALIQLGCSSDAILAILTTKTMLDQLKKRDEEGRFPLHLLAARSQETVSDDLLDVVLAEFPEAAAKRDAYGRFPLFYLAQHSNENTLDRLSTVLKCAPFVLLEKDNRSRLYPFMLAAVASKKNDFQPSIDVIFHLLREGPIHSFFCNVND